MIKTILFDLARVILFNHDRLYKGELNKLHRELVGDATYNFSKVFELDEELLEYIREQKQTYEIYMFTSGTIQEVPEVTEKLEGIFTDIFSAEKLGVSKRESKAYEMVAKLLNKNPEEVMFVDDTQENVWAARKAGMVGIVYIGLEDLKKKVTSLQTV